MRTGQPVADSGEQASEEDLRAAFATHGGELYRFAARCVANPDTAERVVHRVFAQAWRAPEQLTAVGPERREWLLGTAREVMFDVAPMTTETTVDRVRRALDAESRLRRLPEEDRRALLAVRHEGRSYAEAADEAGVSVATVRSRVTAALRSLAAEAQP